MSCPRTQGHIACLAPSVHRYRFILLGDRASNGLWETCLQFLHSGDQNRSWTASTKCYSDDLPVVPPCHVVYIKRKVISSNKQADTHTENIHCTWIRLRSPATVVSVILWVVIIISPLVRAVERRLIIAVMVPAWPGSVVTIAVVTTNAPTTLCFVAKTVVHIWLQHDQSQPISQNSVYCTTAKLIGYEK